VAEQSSHTQITARALIGDASAKSQHNLGDPVFRVVTHQGERYAFKLEDIFWKIIQLAATGKQQRLGAFISSLLPAYADTANKSSVLRVYAAQWLSQRLAEAATKSLNPKLPDKIVKSLPLACFTMDNHNRITSQNEPFLDLLRGLIDGGAVTATQPVRVRFQSDISTIRAAVAKATVPFVDDTIQLQYAAGSLHKGARVISIDTAHGTQKALLVLITN
jgi:predicted DNA-binding ribbon-helix-helix protein